MNEETKEWLKTRPLEIQEAYKKRPGGGRLYRLTTTGHIVVIYSYAESGAPFKCEYCPETHITDEVTVTVLVLEKYNPGLVFERRVFGIKLDELEEIPQ